MCAERARGARAGGVRTGERRTTQISLAPSLSPCIIPKPDPPASAAGAALLFQGADGAHVMLLRP